MAAMSRVLRTAEGDRLMYFCPGCDEHHAVIIGDGNGPRWTWNGDEEKPTFSPSILYRSQRSVPPVTAANYAEWKRSPWPQQKIDYVCHSFVVDGRIQFLGDCTHALAGQTIDMPEID